MADDPVLNKQLQEQLESFNYQVQSFTGLAPAELAAQTQSPDLLIMDIAFDAEGKATDALGQALGLHRLTCPLIFISSTDDFESRVRAARLGAVGYYSKPLDVPQLITRIEQIFERMHAPPQRVFIVDDDDAIATHFSLVMHSAGMQANTLANPVTLMEELERFQPELVLMDLDMPEYSGQELAMVIRQHPQWDTVPIVYLSAETDLERQVSAMNIGGDDFLTKPIADTQLIAAVHVRIERARQLADQINKDSLTGLLKHANIKEAATKEISNGRRTNKPVTLAMIDIDHFKSVNDTYGHASGDLVISALATLLRQSLRKSDHLGRYGGEEFLLVLPDCTSNDAQRLLEKIRARFANLHFGGGTQTFFCTLSAGYATSTTSASPNTSTESGQQHITAANERKLLEAADAALYLAKHGGRNRVYSNMKLDEKKPKGSPE